MTPGHHAGVRERLDALGFADFVDYVVWCCREALERGLLPHTNLGALARDDLARLREVTASQGLMLESLRDDLIAHRGSPTKDPALRLETIRAAGELRIPFTSGILVGIGERAEDRFAALDELARCHREHGHIQELILQNFVPHRRYYGEEPAEVATAAAEEYWRTGLGHHPALPLPDVGLRGRRSRRSRELVAVRARAAPRRRHPGAAEPLRRVAGARRRRGERSRRALRQRRPHLARAPVPLAAPGPPPARARTASR